MTAVLPAGSPTTVWLLKPTLSDSDQGPSCPVLQSKARQPTPDGYTLLPFTITEAPALLGAVKAVEMVLYPRPDLCLVTQFYHGGLQRAPWTSWLGFCPGVQYELLGLIHTSECVSTLCPINSFWHNWTAVKFSTHLMDN